MKDFIKKCPVFLTLAVSGALFSLIGIIGSFSVYKEYEFHVARRPYLALMIEGVSKGTMPWEAADAIGMGENEFPGSLLYEWRNGSRGQAIGVSPDGEAAGIPAESDAGDGSMVDLENGKVPESGNGLDNQEACSSSGQGGQGGAGGQEPVGDPDVSGGRKSAGSQELSEGADTSGGQESAGSQDASGKQEPEGNSGSRSTAGGQREAGGQDTAGAQTAEDNRTYSFQTVTEDYFDDAVFIGDSRTVGLFEYGGIEERADFYAKISLTIYDALTEELAKDKETGKKITVEEALMQKEYGKVYLMLGINELGTGTTDTFMEEYEKVVARIRELQPNAIIYVQGIMKVTGKKDGEDDIFNNTNIEDKNRAIAKLADNRDVFYIDVNEVVCDGEGNLNAEYTIDEVHLKAKYYEIWKQFLLEHGIVR